VPNVFGERALARLLTTGVAGTIFTALCCFTPVLVILLGAIGLSAWLGWLDYVLLPALAVFLAITVYALYRKSAAARPATRAALRR
jgi:mercuric ion transport protein